jgi:2-polyprenyl-3-methyl-5-hydroxy-6-metoxy-1,4-benzoquinol methylase
MSAGLACPVCTSQDSKLVLEKSTLWRATPVRMFRCYKCRAAFQETSATHFDHKMYDYYAGRVGLPRDQLYDPLTTSRYEAVLDSLGKKCQGRKLLDVGCGQGQFVHTAIKQGWDASGIDLSQSAIAICKTVGVPCEIEDFFSANLKPNSYDLLTLFEVIEHVPNPGKFIDRTYDLLKPGGILYLTTPNFDSADRLAQGREWPAIDLEHIILFNPEGLANLVRRENHFHVLRARTNNLSPQTLKKLLGRGEKRQNQGAPTTQEAIELSQQKTAIVTAELALRQRIEKSPLLRTAKAGMNFVMNLTRLGSTLTLTCRKISHEKSPIN